MIDSHQPPRRMTRACSPDNVRPMRAPSTRLVAIFLSTFVGAVTGCGGDDDGDGADAGPGADTGTASEWEVVQQDLPGALLSVWGTSARRRLGGRRRSDGDGPTVLHYDGADVARRSTPARRATCGGCSASAGGPVYMGGAGGAHPPLPGRRVHADGDAAQPTSPCSASGAARPTTCGRSAARSAARSGGFAWRLEGDDLGRRPRASRPRSPRPTRCGRSTAAAATTCGWSARRPRHPLGRQAFGEVERVGRRVAVHRARQRRALRRGRRHRHRHHPRERRLRLGRRHARRRSHPIGRRVPDRERRHRGRLVRRRSCTPRRGDAWRPRTRHQLRRRVRSTRSGSIRTAACGRSAARSSASRSSDGLHAPQALRRRSAQGVPDEDAN